ncbi:1-phosphofructokinase family hexose kinase [Gordonia sp. TBRC 11910]|uniref:1-phosphofructokinase family hexose kinase n=1 Tax=Gordonia asplenii TaxID=2725283 RepID=A0A848KWS8_9ACTN|nr:1-phosphofructokinase family hexose kinase [Gordonia asplenii]NMN99917.1 1-phosphofructokinase family hexose kinase [Gordonia asplenii]
MILTVTANPSIDRTVELEAPLRHGAVQRAAATRIEAGGKGVNVARVAAGADVATLAILPARSDDPMLGLLDSVRLPYRATDVGADVRSNLTVVDPDGTTTKINAAGAVLDDATATALAEEIVANAPGASWVALCGSLPPGLPADWYARLVAALKPHGCKIAVDTSGAPLAAVAQPGADLLKPNADELAELVGGDGPAIEAAAQAGDFGPAVAASLLLAQRTGGTILTTLGAAGALLTTTTASWSATPPPIVPRSTVGAGDASLAGYLLAELAGAEPAERLRRAVAYGSAAAALPGTQPPSPSDLNLDDIQIAEIALPTPA